MPFDIDLRPVAFGVVCWGWVNEQAILVGFPLFLDLAFEAKHLFT